MAAPVVVVLFLVHVGDAALPATTAMVSAARKALGAGAIVTTREADPFPSDEDAAKEADVVAQVTWSMAPPAAHLHVHAKTGWLDRDIGFADADAEEDRGRTVGYVVASIVPEIEAPPPPVAAPPLVPAIPMKEAPPLPPPARAWFLVEVYGVGASGVGNDGAGFGLGGGGSVGFRPQPWLGVRLLADYRTAEVVGFRAGATAKLLRIGAGAFVTPLDFGPMQVGLRLDVAAAHLSVARSTTPTDKQGRWLPSVAILPELIGRLGQSAAIFASIGPEWALGTTTVAQNGETVAVLPRLRALTAVGLRVGF